MITTKKVFVPSKETASAQVVSIENETVAHYLGIDEKRDHKLVWLVEEIMDTGKSKGEGMKMIAALEATTEEKVYMGYVLAKKIVERKTPPMVKSVLDTVYGL